MILIAYLLIAIFLAFASWTFAKFFSQRFSALMYYGIACVFASVLPLLILLLFLVDALVIPESKLMCGAGFTDGGEPCARLPYLMQHLSLALFIVLPLVLICLPTCLLVFKFRRNRDNQSRALGTTK